MSDLSTGSTQHILEAPSPQQIEMVAEWLVHQPHQNPNLEIALNLILQKQIIPHESGGLLAIASTSENLTPETIQGLLLARPNNTNVILECRDRATTKHLFEVMRSRGCPHQVVASGEVKEWLRPLLVQHYALQREHDQQVMVCTQPPAGGEGRWAQPADKPALQAYAEAYLAERGSGSTTLNWDELIQERRVAVLEHNSQIVSAVKQGVSLSHPIVVGTFTFAPFRQQGFGRRLLAFFVTELLHDHAAVKLWVDQDNTAAIALYRSLGFCAIGSCYTSYWN